MAATVAAVAAASAAAAVTASAAPSAAVVAAAAAAFAAEELWGFTPYWWMHIEKPPKAGSPWSRYATRRPLLGALPELVDGLAHQAALLALSHRRLVPAG